MKEKNKVKIFCKVIGVVGIFVAGHFEGKYQENARQNNYITSQIANVINGDNNTVTINNIPDLVEQYAILFQENETLKAQNKQYFSDYSDEKEYNEKLKAQLSETSEVLFDSANLVIDGENISINSQNSIATINEKEYWSKDLASKLVPDNKSITRKENTLYVGNIIANATNLYNLYVNSSSGIYLNDAQTDSYGNMHSNAFTISSSGSGQIIIVLNRDYKFLKFSIAAGNECSDTAIMNYVIKADDNVVYTSPSFDKKQEPFSEDGIDISNCTLLTIQYNTQGYGSAMIYDAVVYN